MSQRVVMWCKLIIALRQAYAAIKPEEVQELPSGQKEKVIRKTGGEQAGWDAAAAHRCRGLARTQSLSEIAPNQIEQEIFRLKPTFQGTSPGQALGLELGQHSFSHTGIQTEPCSTGSLWPEAGTDTGRPRSRSRRPNHLLSPNGSTLNQRARAEARARTREFVESSRRGEIETSMGVDALGDDDMGTEPRSQRRRRV